MSGYPSDHDCLCGRTARVWVTLPDGEQVAACWQCQRRQAADARYLDSLTESLAPPVQVTVDPGRVSRSEAGRRLAAMRRGCSGCDLVSTPAGVAMHQKSSGHVGWVAA